MKRLLMACSLGALGFVVAGCPSATTMGLAKTLDQGRVQGYVAPGFAAAAVVGAGASVGGAFPDIEAGIRYGVTDGAEIGARLGLSGLTLEGKFALARNPTFDSGIDLSLNPGIGFFAGGTTGASASVFNISLPLLVGFNMSGNQLVLGPKLVDQLWLVTGGTANFLYAGLSVGYGIKVSPSFRLLPEISAIFPVLTSAAAGGVGGSITGFGAVIFQGGIGFMFGGYNDNT
jgi:hypothetical protein